MSQGGDSGSATAAAAKEDGRIDASTKRLPEQSRWLGVDAPGALLARLANGCYADGSYGFSDLGMTPLLRMKILTRTAILGSLLLVPGLLHAQNGCVNSPECPTAVLGLVGAAGAALFTRLRSR
jgi:hypothetical protein